MNTHEYQAKNILRKYGIKTPPYTIVTTMEEVENAIDAMGLEQAVIKVQIHAGGRGKAGGVKLARNRPQIIEFAKQMLGMRVINNQTGEEGVIAHKLLITPLISYKKEYYVGAVIDRKNGQSILILSPEGGAEIEEIAEKMPERILKVPINSTGKFRNYQLIGMAKFMGWQGKQIEKGKDIIAALVKAFVDTDASLLEINPLVLTDDGDFFALDAKLSVDDNALYRQPEIAAMYDAEQVSPYEAKAKEYDLAYVALNGEIGCMVNGAGLAMATMDIINHYGGTPANFLDVGGSATKEKVAEGFKILLSDHKVKAILVNIFGGIMNCGTLASGIVAAAKEIDVKVPLIVRLEGTNVDEGRKIIQDSRLNIISVNGLAEAAQSAVIAAKQKI